MGWKGIGNLLKFYENEAGFKNKVNMNVIKFIDEVASFPDRDGTVNNSIDFIYHLSFKLELQTKEQCYSFRG